MFRGWVLVGLMEVVVVGVAGFGAPKIVLIREVKGLDAACTMPAACWVLVGPLLNMLRRFEKRPCCAGWTPPGAAVLGFRIMYAAMRPRPRGTYFSKPALPRRELRRREGFERNLAFLGLDMK